MVRRAPRAQPVIAWAALSLSAAPWGAQAQQFPTAPAPTPASLREMTTDRPDTTESPFTINAGHVQFETTILGYSRAPRDAGGANAEAYEFATTNARIGLTNAFELNLVVHPYGIAEPGGGAARQQGIGAVDVRAKLNLLGNDGGKVALALLPYVSIPTDRNNGVSPRYVEYGLLVPVAFDLSERFGLGLNAGVNVRRDDPAEPYRVYGVATASLAVSWNDRLGSYYEVAVEAGGSRPAAISLNTGITWLVRDNLQLDAGTQFGVHGDAPLFGPFIGFSLRL